MWARPHDSQTGRVLSFELSVVLDILLAPDSTLVSNRPFGQFLAMRAMPPKVELAEPSQTIPTGFRRNVLTAIDWTGLPSNRFRERLTNIHQPHIPKFAHTTLLGHCPL